ncbi:hypothetical protein AGMMS49928_26230 [Spirochaetia bacterium]|nr:hypothetical protein AGMMS49928_26230 [Spirochaetia bacterium]
MERSLLIYLNAFKSQRATLARADSAPDSDDKYGYISLRQASELCEYSIEYLSYLSRTGLLKSLKIKRNWLTTREALMDYIERVKTKNK